MAIKAETTFSLKDDLFNPETLALLSKRIASVHRGFRRTKFEKQVLDRFPELELKQRIDWIVETLGAHLPADFADAIKILRNSLPQPLDPTKTDGDFGQFIWVVPGEYVARHGCSRRYLARSLAFLGEATKRFSSEGAIRPFLKGFPEETMAFVHHCAESDNYHVRRLASEGIRPLLPWAERVKLPAKRIAEVLDKLHADPTRFVTRSVANNLNDISKSDSRIVVATLKRWLRQKRQDSDELEWMVRHALRTLTKRDHMPALEMLGFARKPAVELSGLKSTRRVKVGESFECSFRLRSDKRQKLLITMRLHFLKANGTLAPKVFSLKKIEADEGEVVELTKRQPFRPLTTRVLYPGRHLAEIVVNGQVVAASEFELVV